MTTFNELTIETPNLDCYIRPDELVELRKEIKAAVEGLLKLSRYSLVKEHAMRLRLNGNIATAQKLEAECDRIYRELPEWAAW